MKQFYYSLIIIVLSTMQSCSQKSDNHQFLDPTLPYLNLTEHPIWDEPVLDHNFSDVYYKAVEQSADSVENELSTRLIESDAPLSEYKKYIETMEKMPDSEFKNQILSEFYDNMLFIEEDQMSPAVIKLYLDKFYELAQGKHKVSQFAFFTYWQNSMVSYSNIAAIDSIHKEAQKLLKICHQQQLPLGVRVSYIALAYSFMELGDYRTAADQFEKADEIAESYYPRVLGKNWKEQPVDSCELLINYDLSFSHNALCHFKSADTIWLENHLDQMDFIVKSTSEQSLRMLLYNVIANYYNMIGDNKKCEETLSQFKKYIDSKDFERRAETEGEAQYAMNYYLKALARHLLNTGNYQDVIQIVEENPKSFGKLSYLYADALYNEERIPEAALLYKELYENDEKTINGLYRYTLKAFSDNIENERQQLELVYAQLEKQRLKIIYDTIILAFTILMIIGLAFFAHRQGVMHKRLKKAYEATEHANKVKDIFLKNMTHELHTPMNAVYGFAQILADRDIPLDEKSTRMMADGIKESAEHLNNLLDNIVEVTDKLTKMETLSTAESVLEENKEKH